MRHLRLAPALLIAAVLVAGAQNTSSNSTDDEAKIRVLLARFFEGWNTHDADKMVSIYAEDIDHIDVFGEWHKGREVLRAELARLHAGPLKNSHKDYTIEKIRFPEPDIAVIQVSSARNGMR